MAKWGTPSLAAIKDAAVTAVRDRFSEVQPTRLSDASLKAALLPFWTAGESVKAGDRRVAPDGRTIVRKADGTAGSSYDATEAALWTVAAGTTGLTPTAVKTASYTAAVGDLALMDVPNGGATLTLPTAPADKAQVGYRAIGATTAAPLTITRGGTDTIGLAAATSTTIPLADETVVLQYQASATRWLVVGNVKTQASITQAVVDSGVLEPAPGNTVIPFGTSITNQNFVTSGSPQGMTARGYLSWANIILGHRLLVLRNAGISGNNSSQMLARVQTDVIAYSPDWCVVESGMPNDIGSGFSLTQSIANHKAICDKIKAAGIRIVLTTAMPYGLATGTTTRQQLHGFNAWAKTYAREQGHVLADFHAAVADPTSATGLWMPGYSDGTTNGTDGVHPEQPAAMRLGKVLAAAWDKHLPSDTGLWLPSGPADPFNLLGTAGFMSGVGGSKSGAGGTGDIATGWTLYTEGGAGASYTATKVTRTDGVQGQWQQITATSTNTDSLSLQAQNLNLGTDFAVGDTTLLAAEFQADQDWVGAIRMGATLLNFGGSVAYADLIHPSNGAALGTSPPQAGVLLATGVIPASTTRQQVSLSFKATNGTIRWGRVGLYNLTKLAAAGAWTPR